ncbi:hypothetical protein NQ318_003727, partial [Aromia moschata]
MPSVFGGRRNCGTLLCTCPTASRTSIMFGKEQLFAKDLDPVDSDDNVKHVRDLLNTDRRLSVRLISETLDITKTIVHEIVSESLGMRKTANLHAISRREAIRYRIICDGGVERLNDALRSQTWRRNAISETINSSELLARRCHDLEPPDRSMRTPEVGSGASFYRQGRHWIADPFSIIGSRTAKFARDAWYVRQVFTMTWAHEASTGLAPA